MQRWALSLSAYSYSIKFRSTRAHANADGLSRLPLGTRHDSALSCSYSFAVGQIQAPPVTAEQVASATRTDVVLSKVYSYVTQGWPSNVEEETQPYWRWKEEPSVEQECLLVGSRVNVPEKLRGRVHEDLLADHPGIVRMKAITRSYVWWPKLDDDLERHVHNCVDCQAVKNSPAAAPLHPWLWPAKPWQRVHLTWQALS